MYVDTLIYNGTIVTVNEKFDIIENGEVGIRKGFIQWVEPASESDRPHCDTAIDANGGLIIPGLVNTHTHLPMSLFRGLADDLDLHVWLHEHMFPAEAKYINPVSVGYGARLSCAELLLSGTTTICDGYFFEDNVAGAVFETGIRAVLGQGVIDFPAPGVPDPLDNVSHASAFVNKWRDITPLITPSIFCHSPYTCGEKTLKAAKRATAEKQLVFQIHVAETRWERDKFFADHGVSPVEYLDRLGLLDPDTLLVHTIWVDDRDIDIIAASGAGVSVTTESEMKLASGIAPVPKFISNRIPTGIGTDGSASNNDLDLFREMDFTSKLHKTNTGDPTVLDAQTVFRLATIDGAESIGLGDRVGSIEPGKQADIVILDTHKPHLVPLYHPASHLVYAASGADVRDVMVAGRMVVKDRNVLTIDLEEIMEHVTRFAESVKAGTG